MNKTIMHENQRQFVISPTPWKVYPDWQFETVQGVGILSHCPKLPVRKVVSQDGREYILIGDVNIAHKEADLKNWKGNLKNSGFLPEERAWMTALLDPAGDTRLVDVYRTLHPDATDACYTWWSNRGQARAKNVGWRIDYHLATPGLAAAAKHAAVFKDQWFSDHAPLTIDYDFSL